MSISFECLDRITRSQLNPFWFDLNLRNCHYYVHSLGLILHLDYYLPFHKRWVLAPSRTKRMNLGSKVPSYSRDVSASNSVSWEESWEERSSYEISQHTIKFRSIWNWNKILNLFLTLWISFPYLLWYDRNCLLRLWRKVPSLLNCSQSMDVSTHRWLKFSALGLFQASSWECHRLLKEGRKQGYFRK